MIWGPDEKATRLHIMSFGYGSPVIYQVTVGVVSRIDLVELLVPQWQPVALL